MQPILYKKARLCLVSNTRVSVMKETVIAAPQDSFSFVLTLAKYMSQLQNQIIPPQFYVSKLDNVEEQISTLQVLKQRQGLKYLNSWCDFLVGLITLQNLCVIDQQIFLIGEVKPSYLDEVEKINKFESKKLDIWSGCLSIQSISNLLNPYSRPSCPKQTSSQAKTKIVIINFSTSILNNDIFKPRIQIEGILTGVFYNQSQNWTIFRILKNQIPSKQFLAASNTIILTGSSYSVNSPSLEITSFLTVLKQATQINKDLKILGICFGHQALAHQRGVSVITKPLIKGVEEIQFQDSITMNVPYFQQFRQLSSKKLKCLEYHNDHVTEVPNNHILVASSSKCSIEALISQDFKILSFQFHPEFTAEYIQFYEKCLSNYSNNSDKNSLKVDINANQAEEHHKSIDIVRKTIRHFLSWKIV